MDVWGNVTFHRNTAVFGAGVAMSGRSLVNESLLCICHRVNQKYNIVLLDTALQWLLHGVYQQCC